MRNPEGGPRPTKKEAKQLRHEARQQEATAQMSRRSFLRLGALGTAAAIGVAVGGVTLRNHLERDTATDTDEVLKPKDMTVEGRIQELEALSERLQAPYQALKQHMIRFKEVFENPSIPDDIGRPLREPIHLFFINDKENPLKDHYQLIIEDLRTRGSESFKTPVRRNFGHGAYFTLSLKYADDAQAENYVAAYSPARRDLCLSEQLDDKSTIDGLVGYHELVHVMQDSYIRAQIKTEEEFQLYLDFNSATLGGRPIFNIRAEQDAFLRQLDLFDLITKGKFAKDCRSGVVDFDVYSRQYGATSQEDQTTLQDMISCGRALFQPNLSPQDGQQQLAELVVQNYSKHGTLVSWTNIDELREIMKTQPRDK